MTLSSQTCTLSYMAICHSDVRRTATTRIMLTAAGLAVGLATVAVVTAGNAVAGPPVAAGPSQPAAVAGTNLLAAPVTHLYLMLGQSNEAGRATDYSAALDPGDPRILQFTAAGRLIPAVEPLGNPDPSGKGGPGLAFARAILTTLPAGDRVELIPASYGGTGFTLPDSNGGTRTWDINQPDSPSNMYEQSLRQIAAALAATPGRTRIDAAMINIGGTDAHNHLSGPDFQTYLDALIGGYRSRLGLPNLPFIVGPSRPDVIASNPYYAALNTVQIATPARVAHTAYIPGAIGAKFYKTNDSLHFNMVGQRAMGLQYAHALSGLLNGLPWLRSPTSYAWLPVTRVGAIDPTWNRVRGATGYLVEYKSAADYVWRLFGVTAALDAPIDGLDAGLKYEVRVTATDGSNNLGSSSVFVTP